MITNRQDVVVTGMGACTPLGVGVHSLWDGLRAGRSGVDWLQVPADLPPDVFPLGYAAQVKGFCVDDHLRQHCDVRLERSVQMGMVAAQEAFRHAKLLDESDKLLDSNQRIECILGSGVGACWEYEAANAAYFQRGPRAIRPTTIPKVMFNSLSSNVSIHFGLTGSNLVIASACASGASAIGMATHLVRHGYADIALAGGADSPFTPVHLASWSKLRVLADNPDPQKASRPFDLRRNGMVLAEGAAMVVLESRQNAESRGAVPLAVVRGYGGSSDAHHITAPTVAGQRSAMQRCLNDAGLEPQDVDYINAHGTGTKANDETEARAIVDLFGPRGSSMPVSSIKSMLGHSLGTGGAIEFLACIEALRHQYVPPTINCDEPDPVVGLDYVPNIGRAHSMRLTMSNSFGFGGNNVALLIEGIS